MSEWWTYALSDFLMFSPRTYYRLIELYNLGIWPAQPLAVALGIAIALLLYRGGAASWRLIATLLVLAWGWVAVAFLFDRYDTINWAGRYFAAGFILQALLIATLGTNAARLAFTPIRSATHWLGLAVFLFALCLYPLIPVASGRSWTQAEVFGLAPDPTAIGTLGLALALRGRAVILLAVLPAAWCAITGALLWAMQAPEASLPPAAALLVLIAATLRRPSPMASKA
jgi:hypothetical protein